MSKHKTGDVVVDKDHEIEIIGVEPNGLYLYRYVKVPKGEDIETYNKHDASLKGLRKKASK